MSPVSTFSTAYLREYLSSLIYLPSLHNLHPFDTVQFGAEETLSPFTHSDTSTNLLELDLNKFFCINHVESVI